MKIPALIFSLILSASLILSCQSVQKKNTDTLEQGEWFNGYPLYEIYVRSFSGEGTFKSLEENLPRLKEYGFSNIWLMPVHTIGEVGRKGSMGCPYSVRDYYAVGEEYGTMDDLKSLVNSAHNQDMKVILDMVMNHSANDHVEMENHPDWFFKDDDGNFSREVADWWDVTDWNYEKPEVREYLSNMLSYFVDEVKIDGYRCDVAAMVPHDFWKKTIIELTTVNPEVFMLAEAWEKEMIDDGFHAVYDWDLYHRMKDHRAGNIDLDSLWSIIDRWHVNFPENALALRFVENHDENRSIETFGWPEVKPYAALIFTLPGIPLMYNGQETGSSHKPSLFEREPIDWELANSEAVSGFYKALLDYRNNHETLRKGGLERMDFDGSEDLLVFTRSFKNEEIVIAINFSGEPVSAVIGPDLTVSLLPYDYQVKIR